MAGFTGKKEQTFPNGSVYYGDWVDGKRTGRGTLKTADGGEYTGGYLDDERHGKGKYTWPDGRVYEGDWVNGQRTGKGKETFEDGAVYEGDFVDGLYHGKGKYTDRNLGIYEGDFANGKKNGKGKYAYERRGKHVEYYCYEGDWVDDKKHGQGKESETKNNIVDYIYEGGWIDDERSGKGKIIYAKGFMYEGDYLEGLFHGKGTAHYQDGAQDSTRYIYTKGDMYEGDWVFSKRTGKGKMTYHDGRVQEGNWKDDKFIDGLSNEEIENLSGIQKCYINGELYEGDFFNDKFTGNGKYIWSNGAVYDGDWVNGRFHGKGKNVSQYGDIYEGDWVNGKEHGKGKEISSLGHIYEGEYAFGQKNGKVKETSLEPIVYDVFEGEFAGNRKLGYGKQTYLIGGSFESIFFGYGNNQCAGKGILTYPDGTIKEGIWKNGKFHIGNETLSTDDIYNLFRETDDNVKTAENAPEKSEDDSTGCHVFTQEEINELLADDQCESQLDDRLTMEDEISQAEERAKEEPLFDFQENRQIRIFISSTFRDMMQERDYLITKTFPELRRYCEERDISLFELDLRWGVTQEESESAMTFKICLNEVDNTTPFFIGLLGERYGWVPDEATIEKMKPTNIFDEYEWLLGELQNKKSVTETEIYAGAFVPRQKVNAFFYIRSPKMQTPDEFREAKGSAGEKMLLELKERVRNDERYDTNDYDSVEHLGLLVEEDFKKLVDLFFPRRTQLTDLEKERLQQHVFLKSKTRSYVENPQWMKALDSFVESGEKVLAVTGESGMGKASLLANWIAKRQKLNIENEKIIYHFTGISNSEGDYNRISERLKNELKEFCESSKDDLKDLLYATPVNKKLIIALDSLDLIEDKDNAKMLNWIPEDFPSNVKMIFTTAIGDKTVEPVKRRAGLTLLLDSLPLQIRNELVKEYFKKYSKKLTSSQTERITSDKESENPAVLTALLDNLRVFGQFETFDAQIDERLACEGNESLFDFFLDDIESVFNDKDIVKNILSIIALSRKGLTETEIINVSKIAPLYWSQLSNCMSLYFTTINGFVTFSSGIMLNAVKNRYLKDEKDRNMYRSSITKYMETGDDVLFNRKCDELPFQYMELKDWDKLYKFVLDYKVFNYIYAKNPDELANLWSALLEQSDYYVDDYLRLRIEKETETELAPFFENSCILFQNIVPDIYTCLYFSCKYLESSLTFFGMESRQTAASYNCIGRCYIKSNEYNKAIEYFNKAIVICEKINENTELFLAYGYTASCYNALGDYEKAIECYEKSIQLSGTIYGEENVISARYYFETGCCYLNLGDNKKAESFYNKAYLIQEKILGKDHDETVNTGKTMEVFKRRTA